MMIMITLFLILMAWSALFSKEAGDRNGEKKKEVKTMKITDKEVIKRFLSHKEGKSDHLKSNGIILWADCEADKIAYWNKEENNFYVRNITSSSLEETSILIFLYDLCYWMGTKGFNKPLYFDILD